MGWLEAVAPGAVVQGSIRNITDFGVFVEYAPGVDGMCHISQLSTEHVRSAADVVQMGDEIMIQTAGEVEKYEVTDIKIVPKEELMDEAMKMAEKICQNGPYAVRTAKEIVVRQANLEPGFVLEKAIGMKVFKSHDAEEGPKAFLEKRKPKFPKSSSV